MAESSESFPKACAPDDESDMQRLRQAIDDIDRSIHELVNERARCAQRIAGIKMREAQADESVFYRPEREAQILRRIMARNEGPLDDATVAQLFREIISSCLALEQPLSVAYLGPEGTYTQMAAIRHFGNSSRFMAVASIDQIFREVESGHAHYGVAPVENSTEGIVSQTLGCLAQSPLRICGEIALRIHHCFLVHANAEPERLKRVLAHQQSLAQCRAWLNQHWPQLEQTAVSSNAEAARLVCADPRSAAIASDKAGEIYGLRTMAINIEDFANNSTRFLVIGRQTVAPSGRDKTSILVTSSDQAGALYRVLKPFQKHEINLTRIETRPTLRGDWSYMFFMDFHGHEHDQPVTEMLLELHECALAVKILGSYPQLLDIHA